jgi:hypothetical protein
MKKNQTIALAGILIALLPVAFTACVKDSCKKQFRYTYYKPVYKTRDEVVANVKSNGAQAVKNAGKLFLFGNYIFLNEVDKGIHVIDNSNPSSPQNISFIDIPGNLDIAAKGSILYADLYTDLLAIDISNPRSISVRKIIRNQFPYRAWGAGFAADTTRIIVDWERVDTVVKESCGDDPWATVYRGDMLFLASSTAAPGAASQAAASSPAGIGGSMARFTIMNDRLYTVGISDLGIYNISNTGEPALVNRIGLPWNVETIYPFRDNLFVGGSTGMYIYNVSNPDAPAASGQFSHARICDPVIADDNYAYVTLSSGSMCGGSLDELDILNLSDIAHPVLVKTYGMTNPKGLSKAGKYLFICDGDAGVRIFDASIVTALQQVKTIALKGTYDVITYEGRALIVAKDGLYQFDISDINHIRQLSRISVSR